MVARVFWEVGMWLLTAKIKKSTHKALTPLTPYVILGCCHSVARQLLRCLKFNLFSCSASVLSVIGRVLLGNSG